MKKKILSLILSVFLLLSAAAAVSAADGSAQGTPSYQEAADTLYALGISGAYSEEDLVNKRMTRAEFVSLMIRALNRQSFTNMSTQLFYDVPMTHTAAGDISLAFGLGMINGSDGYFQPDTPITMEQAAKIIIQALGYDAHAKREGGYPVGYFVVADRLGIMKGVNGVGNLILRSGMALQMVFNALEVDLIRFVSVEGDVLEGHLTKGKNMLTEYHNLTKGEGVVTATPVSGLSTPEGTSKNRVEIDHVSYNSGNSAAEKYLGYSVTWYADEDLVLKYAHCSDKLNETIQVEIGDIALGDTDGSAERFVYYDEAGRKKIISVSDMADFLYNGVSTGSFDRSLLDGEGYMTFIDNNRDGEADVVMTEVYTTMIADGVDRTNMRIFGKYASGRILEMDDTSGERTVSIVFEGRETSLSVVQSMDVLSVFESVNTTGKKHIRVVVSRKSVVGQIASVEDDGARITIGDETYDVSAGFTEEAKPLTAGSAGIFYLDAYDRVAHFEATSDGEFGVFHYGYVIAADTGNGLDETVTLKMLTATNEVGEFRVADNARIDGFRPKSGSDVIRQLTTDDGGTAQVVRYKMSEDKLITALDTVHSGPKDAGVEYEPGSLRAEEADSLTLDIPFPEDDTEWRWITSASAFGLAQPEVVIDAAQTKVLVLPQKGTAAEDESYKFTTRSYFIASEYYQISCYKLSDVKMAGLAVVYEKEAVVRSTEHIALVDKVTTAVNEEGDAVQKMTMVYRGQKVDRLTKEDGMADGIKQGDVIRFGVNAANEVIVVQKLADGSSGFGVTSDGSGAGYFYANMNTYVGVVHKKEGSMILYSSSKDEEATTFQMPFLTSAAQYAVYSRKSGKVNVASSYDLDMNLYSRNPEAVIVLGCYGGRVEDIYILDMSE